MEKSMQIMILLVATISCFVYVAYADQGTATFYTAPYVPSACYGYTNEGVMIAAASDAFWNNGAACGKHYRVKCTGSGACTGKTVVVKIVDYCPSGCQGSIDLSSQAFKIIANPDAGKVNVEYDEI